ncbi:MAG: hypothetical protein ACHP9Z_15260 [Streptosporangiales bacterium]
MTQLTAVRDRLERADGLPALLEAAHQGFAVALAAMRAHEDPASEWFCGFVMAAAAAADGRDALLFAPSMPQRGSPGMRDLGTQPPAGRAVRDDPAGSVAGDIAALCGLAAVRLARAASHAPDPGDQDACARAARSARQICELLAGGGT